MTLASVLTGTRFKYYDTLMEGGRARSPTVCRICGERDSPAHLMMHMGEKQLPDTPEEKVEFLTKLAITANAINPHISTPYAIEVATEIELSGMETELDEAQSVDSLSFDMDENQ